MTSTPTFHLSDARARIAAAFDPELIKSSGNQLANFVAEHFERVLAGDGPVLNWVNPAENIRAAADFLDSFEPPRNVAPDAARGVLSDRFQELIATMLSRGQNLHHPRYIGHQVPAPSPMAGWFDAVGALTNQVMAVYEMGPWSTSVENALIERLGTLIGWPSGSFAGLITHGGSIANLTALLTARNVALGDCWTAGLPTDKAPVLIANADSHYAIARSAGILGLGTDNLVKAPLDDQRRIDPERLDELIRKLRDDGRPIVALAASSCATPIGAFDRLDALADVCEDHNIWLHVDAAHGGSALLSSAHRHLLAGIDRADSVVWDAHKMMFVPALCAFVFYRRAEHQFATFQQDAPYLFDPSAPGMAVYDMGTKTLECTKRAAAFGLWGLWSMFGAELFRDLVDVTFATTRLLYDKLKAAPAFETLHVPQCNILAFRYRPQQLETLSIEQQEQFQRQLRRQLIESGDFYIVQTTLNDRAALRVTVMNPLTSANDLDALLIALRTHGPTRVEGTTA